MAVSPLQILIIALIVLVLFGASRIADIGKGLGQGIRNFKKGLTEDEPEPAAKPAEKATQQLTPGEPGAEVSRPARSETSDKS